MTVQFIHNLSTGTAYAQSLSAVLNFAFNVFFLGCMGVERGKGGGQRDLGFVI